MTSREKLIEDFSILSGAAVGVVVVRTKEPFRAIDALKDHCRDREAQFHKWTITTGWQTYKLAVEGPNDEDTPTVVDGTQDIIPALATINAMENWPAKNPTAKAHAFVMHWPHDFCKKDGGMNIPQMRQWLADYAQLFTSEPKRLILVTPLGYMLPQELEDCITIIDCELPTQAELRDSYDDLVEYATAMRRDKAKADGKKGKEAEVTFVDYTDEEVNRILSAGAGMTTTAFEDALGCAFKKYSKELPGLDIDVFTAYISTRKAELVKRSEVLELMPLGNMENVGGLENLKKWIAERAYAFDAEAREYGVDKPRGIALIGPPGCGKSLCAKAVSYEFGVPLIRFDISSVFSSLVGSSEARVREALAMIKAMAPCVVLLDEADKAFDVNSGGDSGVGKRVLGSILSFMQDAEEAIFWIMTANRVRGLPSELLRKGRLDEVFSVSTPTEDEIKDIFAIHLGKRQHASVVAKVVTPEVIVAAAGWVGAEIESVVNEAILHCYVTEKTLTAAIMLEKMEGVVPLSVAHAEQFTEMQNWADQNAKPSSSDKSKQPAARRRRAVAAPVVDTTARKRGRASGLDG